MIRVPNLLMCIYLISLIGPANLLHLNFGCRGMMISDQVELDTVLQIGLQARQNIGKPTHRIDGLSNNLPFVAVESPIGKPNQR